MQVERKARRILVADDEPIVSETIKRMIRNQFDCDVVTASDGSEVLELLAKESFDLVLTDMLMPGLHGVDLIKRIQQAAPRVAILVMTAHPEEFPYVHVVKAGAADFLLKPYQPVELEAKIMRIFKELELREELARDKEHILHDMQEMEKARAAQALAELKYHSLFELSMNGMVLTSQDTYRIVDVNGAFCELCGRPRENLLDQSLFDLIDPYERGRFQQGLALLAQGGRGTLSDMILVQPTGRQVYLDVSVTFITVAEESLVLLAFKDVTQQREIQMQLTDIAQHDSLTGLLNKRTFHMRLEGAVSRARRSGESAVLMVIDLDNFKRCNDSFGHQTGDHLLGRVGEVILKQVRGASDESFRYGGDEFAVLVVNTSLEIAAKIGERIRREFQAGECYGTTMSIGVAAYANGMEAGAFLDAADQALYKAKSQGKNMIQVSRAACTQ